MSKPSLTRPQSRRPHEHVQHYRTNGNSEYEIYDIGNNAISAGYLLGEIRADGQFAFLGGFTAGANCRPAALMLASAGCGHAVALGYVRELPIAIITRSR